MKAYWANDTGEWQMLVFANNVREAKIIAFDNMPMTGIEWIWVRVWLADQKWMKLYNGEECIDIYEGDYETWDEYWEAEMSDYPKPERIELGGRYTVTFQQLEWICHCCGHDNTTDQRMDDYNALYGDLILECDLCGKYHETPKTILKK